MSIKNPQKIILALLLTAVTACSPSAPNPTSTQGPTSVVIRYQTPSAAQLFTESSGPVVETLTETPATYVVVQGDTFFSIAATLGISLDALIATNPNVDARLLTPGTILVLPSAGGDTATPNFPTPTPVPLDVSAVNCYSSKAGELWCFVLVQNTLSVAVENLSAVVDLFNAQGDLVATLEATPPLNLLDLVRTLPLVAYSPEIPDGWVTAQGKLLSAYPVNQSTYYLVASVQQANADISEDGLTAKVTGRVEIQGGEAGTIWVLAVAYDANDQVVGIRRWESETDAEFEFSVYSLGPEISTVDLLVEVRP